MALHWRAVREIGGWVQVIFSPAMFSTSNVSSAAAIFCALHVCVSPKETLDTKHDLD
jgi:hypothetical protein